MSRLACVLLSAISLLFVSGCETDTEALARQSIAAANNLADALEAGKSDSEIEAISARLLDINTAIKSLSAGQLKSLRKQYGKEFAKAMRRVCKWGREYYTQSNVPRIDVV
jgi:hypothetical protein